jgi:uncharacterized protein YutE (UPF0331/DUF86 family)
MTPGKIARRVALERLGLIDELLEDIRDLPLNDQVSFFADKRNVWAAESCLRRCLEALFDLGRHILAKGFGQGVSEYKEIALELGNNDLFSQKEMELLRVLTGYRNRLVHFYHEVSKEELYQICASQLGDVELVRNAFLDWLKTNQDRLDDHLVR